MKLTRAQAHRLIELYTDTPARAECRASPLVAESLSSGMAPLPGVH